MFNSRRYVAELGGAFVLYAVLLVGSNLIDRALNPTGFANLALALSPMIGALAAAWAIMRGLWRMDELQRRIQFDAIAFSFLGTAVITFGWGFAESAGAPTLRAFSVWPLMGTLWGFGMAVAHWRYR